MGEVTVLPNAATLAVLFYLWNSASGFSRALRLEHTGPHRSFHGACDLGGLTAGLQLLLSVRISLLPGSLTVISLETC